MNATILEDIFKDYGFHNEEWKFWTQVSLQESSIKKYFDQWSQKLNVNKDTTLSLEIERHGLMSDFLQGIGAQEKRFFQSIESFHDFMKYGLSQIKDPNTCKIYVPFASDGKDVVALSALLYEKWPFAKWEIYAEEHNVILASSGQRMEYKALEVNHASGAYFQAGGVGEWKSNFDVDHEIAYTHPQIKKHIKWNVIKMPDSFDVVFCPNILIKMNATYRNEVLERFDQLLIKDGLIVMGQYDSLRFSSIENNFETLTENETLFKKL